MSQIERDEITGHVADLRALCGPTPADSAEAEAEMLMVITKKILLVWISGQQNETSVEARADAFMDAVDDLPVWSVSAAMRRWHRGDCGRNDRGEPFDYHWAPAPGELRVIAQIELWRVKERAAQLEALLSAVPLIEYSDEHCADMRARLHNEVFHKPRTPLVGRNDSGGAATVKAAERATVGRNASAAPA